MTTELPKQQLESYAAFEFQKQLWLIQRIAPKVGVANISTRLQWKGPLAIGELQDATSDFIVRHPFLRTSVEADQDGKLIQIVRAAQAPEITLLDLRHLQGQLLQEELGRCLARATETPIEMDCFPQVRVVAIRTGVEQYDIAFIFSHLTCDGLSTGVLCRDFLQAYESRLEGRPPSWSHPVPKDMLASVASALIPAQEMKTAATANTTQMASRFCVLPYDRPPQTIPTYKGRRISFRLSDSESKYINMISRKYEVSPFVTWLSLVHLVLFRYSQESDFHVDIVKSGRTSEQRRLVGPFFETVGIELLAASTDSFVDLLHRNQIEVERLNLLPAHELPPSAVRSKVLIDYQTALKPVYLSNGVEVVPSECDNGAAIAELCVGIRKARKKQYFGHVKYDVELYGSQTIDRFVAHLLNAISLVAENPELALSRIDVRTDAERARVETVNSTNKVQPHSKLIDEQFFDQALNTPNAIAIVDGSQKLSFRDLRQSVLRIAEQLRREGVRSGDRVGILLPRNAECVATMIATMSLGAAYVPMDADGTLPRQQMIMQQADLECVVSCVELAGQISKEHRVLLVEFESNSDDTGGAELATGKRVTRSAEDTAYVLFTSGSTGIPKGVEVTHSNVTNFFLGVDDFQKDQVPGCWLSATNVAFDISVFELLWTLTRGFRVILDSVPERDERQSEHENPIAKSFAKLVAQHNVTHFQCTPALMQLLIRSPENRHALQLLSQIFVGGDVLPRALASELATLTTAAIHNMYGPTETTIWSTAWKVEKDKPVRIGTPLANQTVHVLDRMDNPRPTGFCGELFIGGAGVSKGYLSDPKLTAEKFIDHPEFGRLYRTGDVVKSHDDGSLEFIDRMDNQVKFMGHRIELGEIEAGFEAHPSVQQCAIVQSESGTSKSLCAFVQLLKPQSSSEAELFDYVNERLPSYMIPSSICILDSMPMNSSGKLDRNYLKSQATSQSGLQKDFRSSLSKQLPGTEWQQQVINQLVEVVQRELNIDELPLDGQWTDLQISSLDVVGLVVKVEQELGMSFPVTDFFRQTNIRETLENAAGLEHDSRVMTKAHSDEMRFNPEIEEGVI